MAQQAYSRLPLGFLLNDYDPNIGILFYCIKKINYHNLIVRSLAGLGPTFDITIFQASECL